MAQNCINLIEEFSEEQKNNDYIIFASFCFDPYFFDKYLFHKICANNPEAEVLVLIDGLQYMQSLEKFTNETGRKYHLIPIYANNGVFHPKIYLFISKRKKEVTIYIGSSNITLPGFTRNAEIGVKIQYDSNYLDKNIYSIKNFFISLINKKYIRDEKSILMLSLALDSFPTKNAINEDTDYEFIHNLDNSILSEMMKSVNSFHSYEAILLAPFFAPDESVIKKMIEYININKFLIALPKDRHNLVNPEPYINCFNLNNKKYSFQNATYLADESRIIHSKLIYLKGKMQYLLVGSPNITGLALLKNGEIGNIECAILFKGNDAEEFLQNINFVEIKNWKGLNNLEIDDEIFELSIKNLKVYSAEFNGTERSLRILIEPVNGDISVNIIFESEKESLNEYFPNFSGDELKIRVPSGIPKDVIISSNEKEARFRIYDDRNYFFRNLPKTKESFKQIVDRLSNDFTIDLSDIHAMIIGLARRNQESEEKIYSDKNPRKEFSKAQLQPGKIRCSSSIIISHIHKINQICNTLSFTQKQRSDYQDSNLGEDDSEEYDEPSIELPRNKSDNFDIYLGKFIDFVNNILNRSVSFTEEEKDKKDIQVQAQSIFIDSILKSYNNALKAQHFEQINTFLCCVA